MNTTIRNRIIAHTRVRAGDLVPHELNPRTHSDDQRAALAALYGEIGFARSVLAYQLPDGRLKLIDGHLRQSMDPDQMIDVEVLDLTDEEARKLLLSLDPLAALAGYDTAALDKLREITQTDNDALHNLWASVASAGQAAADTLAAAIKPPKQDPAPQQIPEQFLLIVECKNEQHQVQLLRRFRQEGLTCSAKIA